VDPADRISRELKILSAIEEGYSNKQIAEDFRISEDTVRYWVARICTTMGVRTRWGLMRMRGFGFWQTVRRSVKGPTVKTCLFWTLVGVTSLLV